MTNTNINMRQTKEAEIEIEEEELQRLIDEHEEYERRMIKEGRWEHETQAPLVLPEVENPQDDPLRF